MGSDCIEYEGHLELFNDFDLSTLRHFFIVEARAMEAAQPGHPTTALCEFFEAWDWQGPGVFLGTDFSQYVLHTRARWKLLNHLLQSAGDRISAFGDQIPLDYLKTHINTPDAYFTKSQPTARYLVCIGRICTLLTKYMPPMS